MFDARKSNISHLRFSKIENRLCSIDKSGVISGVIQSDEIIISGVVRSDEIVIFGVVRSDEINNSGVVRSHLK